jgi:hypothetical protein
MSENADYTVELIDEKTDDERFQAIADGCLFAQICFEQMIPCDSWSCPLERHARMR